MFQKWHWQSLYFATEDLFKVQTEEKIQGASFTCIGVHQTNNIFCQPECVIILT